jgi:hypothetical protein
MAERRRSPRFQVHDVRGVLVLRVEAKIVNVSLTGAALELASPIQAGQLYNLELRSGSQTLRLRGRVVWCRPVVPQRNAAGETTATYHAGLRFDGVLDERGEALLGLFRESEVVSFGQRLCARFRLETPRPVDLATEHEFEVRKISRTGMLIETELATDLNSVCELEVELGDDAFRAHGRIAHLIAHAQSAGDAPRSRYQLGLEFIELSGRDREVLERFIAVREGQVDAGPGPATLNPPAP